MSELKDVAEQELIAADRHFYKQGLDDLSVDTVFEYIKSLEKRNEELETLKIKPKQPSDEEIIKAFYRHCDGNPHVSERFIAECDVIEFARDLLRSTR
jgi:hypothetical protein